MNEVEGPNSTLWSSSWHFQVNDPPLKKEDQQDLALAIER